TMLVLWFQTLNPANASNDVLFVPQADEQAVYDVFPRQQRIPLSLFGSLIKQTSVLKSRSEKTQKLVAETISLPGEIEHYTVSGSVLKYAGIKLNQQFSGTGFDDETRVLGDFGSRLYIIRKR
ncbi:MAG: GH36 C-terminal domain-containing protein, partial [Sphaerochaetaceae bacterium]